MECFHSQLEDSGVGLANADDGRLDDVEEHAVEAELVEHALDVAVEIAHEDHREPLVQLAQHVETMGRRGLHFGIEVVEHGLVLRPELFLGGIPCTMCAEVLHLEAYLRGEGAMEGVVGLDDGVSAQRALTIDVGIAELLLRDGYVLALVGMPELLAPMLTTGVERSAVVEYHSLY